MPTAFISYRRQDSSAASRWIAQSISTVFGSDSVFIDTEAIRVGTNWRARLDDALEQAKLLIAVIGRSWLTIPDKYGTRRLDHPNDWVRNEIAHSLGRGIPILPLLISGAELPPEEALDQLEDIKGFLDWEALSLNDRSWDTDLAEVFRALERYDFVRLDVGVRLFPIRELTLRDLNHKEIAAARAKLKPGWEAVPSPIPGQEPLQRIELRRVFEFASFKDAMSFINDVAKHAAQVDHHPRWENMWRTVTVWLSTWDIGQKPSQIDVEMAEKLDRLFAKYSKRKVRPLIRGPD
jgi:pterin-4a-carbinolamine dehydratase